MSRIRSVQTAHLGVDAIEDGVLHLANGQQRAVLEVGSVNFGLKGEIEQEAIVASYAAFLNSLSYPVQILVRVLGIDIEAYLVDLERRLPHAGSDRLAELGRDHIAFLRRLAHRRTLLERRFYLVVPGAGQGHRRGRLWPFRSGRHANGSGDGRANGEALPEINRRCEEIARDLGRAGLSVRRLEGPELAQLLYACWCPDLARIQRFRRDLADYTSLVVHAAPRGEPRGERSR
jgi:hypothetical protein